MSRPSPENSADSPLTIPRSVSNPSFGPTSERDPGSLPPGSAKRYHAIFRSKTCCADAGTAANHSTAKTTGIGRHHGRFHLLECVRLRISRIDRHTLVDLGQSTDMRAFGFRLGLQTIGSGSPLRHDAERQVEDHRKKGVRQQGDDEDEDDVQNHSCAGHLRHGHEA